LNREFGPIPPKRPPEFSRGNDRQKLKSEICSVSGVSGELQRESGAFIDKQQRHKFKLFNAPPFATGRQLNIQQPIALLNVAGRQKG